MNFFIFFIFDMKKNTHPLKQKNLIIFSNGSTLTQNFNFFKKIFKTDSDFLNNELWKIEKK